MRPLKVEELHAVLEWDTTDKIHALERSVVSHCGHFVYIDKQRNIHPVHQTTRAFLMRDDLDSDFTIRWADGHLRLANACLTYLTCNEMKPPQNQKLAKIAVPKHQKSAFIEYSSTTFSEQIRSSHSYEDVLMVGLAKFLKSNVLTWMEWFTQGGDLTSLTHAAKDFRGFLDARAKYQAPVGKDVQFVESWSTDLIRLVTKFGKRMLDSLESKLAYTTILPRRYCHRKTIRELSSEYLSLGPLYDSLE